MGWGASFTEMNALSRYAVVLAASAVFAVAADEVVFEGQPQVRIDSDGHETKKAEFSKEAVCRVEKHGRHYVWASRDNRRLDRVDAGDFVYYISLEGSGYVKVRQKPGPSGSFDYLEQLSTGLTTVTYWGKAFGAGADRQ